MRWSSCSQTRIVISLSYFMSSSRVFHLGFLYTHIYIRALGSVKGAAHSVGICVPLSPWEEHMVFSLVSMIQLTID